MDWGARIYWRGAGGGEEEEEEGGGVGWSKYCMVERLHMRLFRNQNTSKMGYSLQASSCDRLRKRLASKMVNDTGMHEGRLAGGFHR